MSEVTYSNHANTTFGRLKIIIHTARKIVTEGACQLSGRNNMVKSSDSREAASGKDPSAQYWINTLKNEASAATIAAHPEDTSTDNRKVAKVHVPSHSAKPAPNASEGSTQRSA